MLDLRESSNRTTMMTVSRSALQTAPVSANRDPRPERFYKMDHLSASIMHDLRNPLAAIYGCAEMLLDANLDAAQTRRVASNIHRAASRMRELLSGLTRIARGHTEAKECCNLRAVLEASCEAAGVAERDGIEILLDVPARIEIPLARARMECVFLNLIVNALEAMPRGGAIRITAVEAGDCALIEVEDTGPGIPAEIRSRLFEPFVTAGKKEGLGLGLTLSRQAVRDHGGELWAEPAAGACFVMSLPLRSAPAETLNHRRRATHVHVWGGGESAAPKSGGTQYGNGV